MRVAKVFPPKRLNSGKLLGFTDVVFSLVDDGNGCVTIRGWKIFKGDNGKIQVGPPSRSEGGKCENCGSGKDKEYYPVMSFNFDTPEAKEFINHVTEEIAKVYNATSSDVNQEPQGVKSDDIPF